MFTKACLVVALYAANLTSAIKMGSYSQRTAPPVILALGKYGDDPDIEPMLRKTLACQQQAKDDIEREECAKKFGVEDILAEFEPSTGGLRPQPSNQIDASLDYHSGTGGTPGTVTRDPIYDVYEYYLEDGNEKIIANLEATIECMERGTPEHVC